MASVERDDSRDRELVLKHQSSFSDSGRSVPMWDSSDPERAPPPLPLNPNTSSPATKPNASKAIAIAAEALTAKARENNYTNTSPQKSPEKSVTKGHKRFESTPTGNLRNKNSYTDALKSLEKAPSPEKSPERVPRTPGADRESRMNDRARSGTPTPAGRDSGRDTPSYRIPRSPLKPILGENTPPSATMLALQNMAIPKDIDVSLLDVTNQSTPSMRQPPSIDAISSQILSLTTIATGLQKEMAQLSRRSKDNATDLVSLKEATNLRDEDIRKSLKDLASNLNSKVFETDREPGSRAPSSFGHRPASFLLDSKPHNFESNLPKSFSVPRMGSPNFNSSDLSGSTCSVEGPASIALLEKVYRDMGTKESQASLTTTIDQLKSSLKAEKTDPQILRKLDEICSMLKDGKSSQALIHLRDAPMHRSPTHKDFDSPELKPAPLNKMPKDLVPQREAPRAGINPKAADFVNGDLQKLLKRMKDSITEGGGMTAEVKASLRELRGEVLGMGRDIARKLEQTERTHGDTKGTMDGLGRGEIEQIVQDGLADLRDHMESLLRERRRQSASSLASRNTVDSQEVYNAVKSALVEFPQQQLALRESGSSVEREDILQAVRDAWETYKPEIELQNFGLERDEILQCLKEGLQQYQPRTEESGVGGATYEEVLDAVREGLQNFKSPPIESEASMTREEILYTVRECLESFEFPVSQANISREPDITRDDVLDAVREGLSTQAPISKEIEFNRDDLFDAVKAGLQGTRTPMGGVGEQVLDKMEELIDGMRIEFKQYSEANGGDTEQILDAMKDGLEVLRSDIESYVDRAQDVTGKDEILDTLRHGLETMRADLEESIANTSRPAAQGSSVEILDAMEKEFDHLRQTINSSMLSHGESGINREDILETIREGLDRVGPSENREIGGEDTASAVNLMREEFSHLRETLATTLIHGGSASDKDEVMHAIREGYESIRTEAALRHTRPESVTSNTSELLEAFSDGLETLKGEIEKVVNRPQDMTVNYEILETLKEGLSNVRADVERLQRPQSSDRSFAGMRNGEVVVADPEVEGAYKNDVSKLEVMIAQLQIKVEALDQMGPQTSSSVLDDATRGQLDKLETAMREVKTTISQSKSTTSEGGVTKEDMEAFETLLRNTKAKVEDIASSDGEGIAKVSHLDSLESIMNETRDAVADLESDGASKRDVEVLEALLKEIRASLEDLRDSKGHLSAGEQVSKTDIEALETLCMDTKAQIAELPLPDLNSIASRDDVLALRELAHGLSEAQDHQHELTAQAFDARKTEHAGLADKIEDVKLIFEDVREELKARIAEGNADLKDIGRLLDAVSDNVTATDTTASIEELSDNLKKDFEAIRSSAEGIKDHNESNHSILLEKHAAHKADIVNELTMRIDARFDEIMTKYDDAQAAAKDKERSYGAKDDRQEEAVHATKSAAEDLRILVDALGSSLTEQCERISEDSKTVFGRVEEVNTKLDSLLECGEKAEHQETRAEISKTLISLESIQAHASEYDPKILDSINAVLAIVGQHYDQVRASTEEIKTSVNAIPGAIPLPAIPANSEAVTREVSTSDKYDDSAVHSKLDQLVSHAAEAGKTMAEFNVLEQIKEQVAATSSQLADFVATQQNRIAEQAGEHAKEAEEAAIVLEKRNTQKTVVEGDIVRLSGDRDQLESEVQALRAEKAELSSLKSKMQADLSSLETALGIRREELQIMEDRADGLERRILDGILDHSRSLLSTSSRPQSSLQEMNRKRVVSTASNASNTTKVSSTSSVQTTVPTSAAPSAVSSGVGMAIKSRRAPRASAANSAAGSRGGRRILSLSTLGGNRGAIQDKAMVLAGPKALASGGNTKPGTMQRSHSVKSNFAPSRKSSWGGQSKAVGLYHEEDVEMDKENSILDEEEEAEDDGRISEAGTERRTSYTGTYTGTESSSYTTGTGSYGEGSLLGTDDERRTSWAPSTTGTVGTRDFAIEEESEFVLPDASSGEAVVNAGADDVADKAGPLDLDANKGGLSNQDEGEAGGLVLFGQQNSDSGIGTDIPTALVEGGSDYFKKD